MFLQVWPLNHLHQFPGVLPSMPIPGPSLSLSESVCEWRSLSAVSGYPYYRGFISSQWVSFNVSFSSLSPVSVIYHLPFLLQSTGTAADLVLLESWVWKYFTASSCCLVGQASFLALQSLVVWPWTYPLCLMILICEDGVNNSTSELFEHWVNYMSKVLRIVLLFKSSIFKILLFWVVFLSPPWKYTFIICFSSCLRVYQSPFFLVI